MRFAALSLLLLSTTCSAQHKLNLPKAPREYNEDKETGILLGSSVLTVGFIGAAAGKDSAPVLLPISGLGVAVCMTIYSIRWDGKRDK